MKQGGYVMTMLWLTNPDQGMSISSSKYAHFWLQKNNKDGIEHDT